MSLTSLRPETVQSQCRSVDRWCDSLLWPRSWSNRGDEGWSPAFDLYDGDHEVTVKIDAPGMIAADFEVRVGDNLLTVYGEPRAAEGGSMAAGNHSIGARQCMVVLPQGIYAETISASYGDGVLTLKIPRRAQARVDVRRIPVSSASTTPIAVGR